MKRDVADSPSNGLAVTLLIHPRFKSCVRMGGGNCLSSFPVAMINTLTKAILGRKGALPGQGTVRHKGEVEQQESQVAGHYLSIVRRQGGEYTRLGSAAFLHFILSSLS